MPEQAVKLVVFVSPEVYRQLTAEAAAQGRGRQAGRPSARSVTVHVAALLERHCVAECSRQAGLPGFAFGGREGAVTGAKGQEHRAMAE